MADAYSKHGNHPKFTDLDSLAEEVIVDCERLILEFIDRWEQKFEESLGARRPARKAKKVWRSIQWSLQEREKVRELREKLSQTARNITLLATLTAE
ncbi:hypothetical protein IMZ48_26575 [Candidatus Bathyarchaeota archaeon]|nr:hypothetical protein [Candidatus Bathyarchaeota archaeon]